MNAVAAWANRHDSAKLILITLVLIATMLLAGAAGESALLLLLLITGMALCGVVAYWLGNWKWLLIPPLAMLVFIVLVVPAVMFDPSGGETPFSIVIESPFWAGLPAFLGAGAGMAIHALVNLIKRRRH
jgi:hypothetical protein